jgi:hypothetical protein
MCNSRLLQRHFRYVTTTAHNCDGNNAVSDDFRAGDHWAQDCKAALMYSVYRVFLPLGFHGLLQGELDCKYHKILIRNFMTTLHFTD